MIEFKKDWWKIAAAAVLSMIGTLIVQNVVIHHNDTYQSYKENKDDHAEIVRGILTDIETVKKDCNNYTDAKYDSILLLLKEQKGQIDAIYTYILNNKK